MKRIVFFASTVAFSVAVLLSSCSKDDTTSSGNGGGTTPTDARSKAITDYKNNYLGSKVTAAELAYANGNMASCQAGSVSQISHNKVIQRINYYRRLVGLPASVAHNPAQNQSCQEAALYMAANNTLTHYPSASGSCYTAGAADAAGHGNIAISNGGDANTFSVHAANAVTGYMEDPGANNLIVGHRAWILLPALTKMGHGSVYFASTNNRSANCLMWGDNFDQNFNYTSYVAYPPNGYIPAPILFPRWSFSLANANFANAQVSMKNASNNTVNVNVIARETNPGSLPENRIVWEPQNINFQPTADTKYTVTVSGITGAAQTSYTYTVNVIGTSALPASKDAVEFPIPGTRSFLSK
jgi:uncharacterized protein YkwD